MTTTAPEAPPFEPAALPEGRYACPSCGAAVVLPPRVEVFDAWHTPPSNLPLIARGAFPTLPSQPFPLARCAACRPLRDQAAVWAPNGGMAAEQAEAALCALVVLGKPLPPMGSGLSVLVGRLAVPGRLARWMQQARPGLCSPEPWAHVTAGDRAELIRAYAGMLAERMAAKSPPLRIAPPEVEGGLRGCLMCGVSHVELPAVKAVRMGGEKSAAWELWHRYSMSVPSPKGAQRREGHVCPACKAAIDRTGSYGPTARGRALLDYLTAAGRLDEARELRGLLTLDDTVMNQFPAWCARWFVPSLRPWDHLAVPE